VIKIDEKESNNEYLRIGSSLIGSKVHVPGQLVALAFVCPSMSSASSRWMPPCLNSEAAGGEQERDPLVVPPP
jgi:hypothetical protein